MSEKKGRENKKNRVEWDPQSVREDRSYGFFWYDWLWRLVRPFIILITSAIILIGGIAFAYNKVYENYLMPIDVNDNNPVAFFIESGSSLTTVARKLEEEGFVRNRSVIKYLMDFQGLGSKIKAGEYTLSHSMTLSDIIGILTTGEGKAPTRMITVIPGWKIETIAKSFAEQGIISSEQEFLDACRTGEIYNDYYYV
ncbi:MAG: endolytic transglycosylase MltG, partial [Oscillospiraceae bacterium]|nr:endolytic transglycosylase MltG [Oscillospiraceae bacterium]